MTQEFCLNCECELPEGKERYRLFGKVYCENCYEKNEHLKTRLQKEKRGTLLGILCSLEKEELEQARALINDLLLGMGRVN